MYRVYEEGQRRERGTGRDLDKPVTASLPLGRWVEVTVTNVRVAQKVTRNGELVSKTFWLDMVGPMGEQHSEPVDLPEEDQPSNYIGSRYKVKLGHGPGAVVQRGHADEFIALDAESGEVYEEGPWETFSEAEEAIRNAGLVLSQPCVVEWQPVN